MHVQDDGEVASGTGVRLPIKPKHDALMDEVVDGSVSQMSEPYPPGEIVGTFLWRKPLKQMTERAGKLLILL